VDGRSSARQVPLFQRQHQENLPQHNHPPT
jgi:hypothetical protein